jgi:hypothetical protein
MRPPLRRSFFASGMSGRSGRSYAINYYVAIITQSQMGEWDVRFPDLPECAAHGSSLEDAKNAAFTRALECSRSRDPALPPPMDVSDLSEWMSRNEFDISKALVAMIPLGD